MYSVENNNDHNQLINLYTNDPQFKFYAIRSILPINDNGTSDRIKIDNVLSNVLYSVLSNHELDESTDLNKIFYQGYQIIAKRPCSYHLPMYKKLHFSQFPNVVIDEERCRMFYLKSNEWLISSHESNCMSARNIAILIARKELGKRFKSKTKFNKGDKSYKLIMFHLVLYNFMGLLFHTFLNRIKIFF